MEAVDPNCLMLTILHTSTIRQEVNWIPCQIQCSRGSHAVWRPCPQTCLHTALRSSESGKADLTEVFIVMVILWPLLV